MTVPGGVASQIKAFDPAMFSGREAETLTLPAYSGGSEPRYAKPASATATNDPSKSAAEAAPTQSLIQQRDQLAAQLHALNAQAASLTAYIQAMQAQVQRAVRKRPAPGAGAQGTTHTRRQAWVSQISAAQADLAQKEAALGPENQAVTAAKYKVQSLTRTYQELPIREKQEFVKEVHQYVRKQVTLINTLADAGKPEARRLSSVRRQQRQLQAEIALLNSEIASHDASAPGH